MKRILPVVAGISQFDSLPPMQPGASSVVLVGFRASGKTTVAKALSQALAWPWSDTDAEIEAETGRRIAQIFASDGEAEFRRLERLALLRQLAQPGPWILASGGGLVTLAENRADLVASQALVVWLRLDAATTQARLRRDLGRRPALRSGDPIAEVPAILSEREPWYDEVANLELDAARPVADTMRSIVSRLTGTA